MGECGENKDVEKILKVIQITSIACVWLGIGAVICGILTLVYADPVWDFPYTSGAGLWAGIICFLQGAFGLLLVRKYDRENIPYLWIRVYHGMTQANTTVSGIHLGYAISGVVQCAIRSENNGREKCNVSEHDNLLNVQAASVAIGFFMVVFAFFGIFYLLCCGRVQALTKNPKYGRCNC